MRAHPQIVRSIGIVLLVIGMIIPHLSLPAPSTAANPWTIKLSIENSGGTTIARVACSVSWNRLEEGFSDTITCKVTDSTSNGWGVWMQFATRPMNSDTFVTVTWTGTGSKTCKRQTIANGATTCKKTRRTAETNYAVRVSYGLTRNGQRLSTFTSDAMNVPGRT